MKGLLTRQARAAELVSLALAVLVLGLLASLGIRSVVFETASAEPSVPNPGHSYDQVELPPGVWPGLNADTLDGIDSSGFSTGPHTTSLPWSAITSKPAGIADDIDNDTLAGLSCTGGQIPKWNGSAWQCAADAAGAPMYCTWSGKTYSTGAECAVSSTCSCVADNLHKRCQADGSWSDFNVYGCPCRTVCGW